jgi:hypothetical protein
LQPALCLTKPFDGATEQSHRFFVACMPYNFFLDFNHWFQKMKRRAITSFAALSVLCIAFTGCGGGGDFGYVEGTVTLDGAPLPNALIGFYPTGGRGSIGSTDSEGHYSLRYTANQKGASVGSHKVTISTAIEEVKAGVYERTGEKREAVAGRKEMLDKKYQDRQRTPLTATVKPGNNPPIDFNLTSEK